MILRPLAALLLAVVLSACVDQSIKSTSVPSVNAASAQVSEELLLDVSIVVFDPGLDDYDEDQQVYPEVRKAEARYMPGLLSQAIQDSGAWGAVRVVPSNEQFTDLMVQGKILYSDGEELQLQINATDSRGYVWLDKKYTGNSSHYAYKVTTRSTYDPFQAVYNTIANDLLQSLEELRPKDRENVRLITELLFARSFSQDAFDGYLAQDRKGRYMVMRLPAENDPMLERVQAIRERDRVFVDTLQEYYVNFDAQMTDPYQEWRRLSYEESMALQELKAESTRRLIAGTVAILAGIAGASSGDSAMTRTAGQVAIVGGGFLLKSGLEKRSEARIHVEALEELGMSLEAEIAPQVIELEDRTVMLSGNVEDQYSQWREVLADIYRTEIGELELPENSAATTDTL
ncbi:MAG: hypothetical protein DRQ97_04455 [Gammaproteobacteria bacterium]|nr:MAG: hypothetical protein DRQ97_04455 [Gammaproteobacteria bacterium]